MKTFYLPDLGEGLPEGEIIEWHVKENDTIKIDDPLVSIETAKAIVEVPSPYSGKVIKFYGQKGDIIPTGSPLADFEVTSKESSTVAGEINIGNEVLEEKVMTISPESTHIKILPAVRALAKKLNVDLTTIIPTGIDGTITAQDVKNANQQEDKIAFEPLQGTRRTMAMVMAQSHAQVVPVTIMDDVDITAWVSEKTFTVRLILALVKACQQEPALNSWYDGIKMAKRIFSQVHIGLAVDTSFGLFVPVIKNAQEKSSSELTQEIIQLRKSVLERSITPHQLQGASIVLSNFGKFAGRYAEPIVVPPTVAILGAGSWRDQVVLHNNEIKARAILPLSFTFDHRAATGGEATRFLKVVKEYLES